MTLQNVTPMLQANVTFSIVLCPRHLRAPHERNFGIMFFGGAIEEKAISIDKTKLPFVIFIRWMHVYSI